MSATSTRWLVITVLALASVACARVVTVRRVDELAGEWKGRRVGPVGNAPAAMAVAANGGYTGVIYFDAGDRPFHGALVVVRPGQIRYQGSDGTGVVHVSEKGGRRVLEFRRDDGGVDAFGGRALGRARGRPAHSRETHDDHRRRAGDKAPKSWLYVFWKLHCSYSAAEEDELPPAKKGPDHRTPYMGSDRVHYIREKRFLAPHGMKQWGVSRRRQRQSAHRSLPPRCASMSRDDPEGPQCVR
jgi:hypothetical protein